jgi:PAS domain S-box-containing protein
LPDKTAKNNVRSALSVGLVKTRFKFDADIAFGSYPPLFADIFHTDSRIMETIRIENRESLLADKVKKLYDHAVLGLIATIINSCILVLALWGQISPVKLLSWSVAVAIVCILRLILYIGYSRNSARSRNITHWKNLFFLSLFLTGILWGAPGVFLFPSGSIAHQVFIAFVIGGMVAGSVGSYTSILTCFYLFSVPAILPVTIRFFAIGNELHLAMGLMLLVFFLIMAFTAMHTHRDYERLLALRYENRGLVDDLRQEVNQRKQAEEDLRRRNSQIEKIVESRTAELKQAVEQLKGEVQTRKKVALALKESRQRIRAIINCAPLLIWAVDKDGVFTFSAGKSLEKVGFQPGEVVGKSVFALFQDNEQLIHNTRKVLAGELVDGPAVYKDVIFENRYEPILNETGEIVGAIGVGIDITSQQQAQEAVRKGEEKYRELVENINEVLFILDQTGKVLYISPVVESILGYHPADMQGEPICNYIDAGDRVRFNTDFEQSLTHSGKVYEYRFIDQTSQSKWCRTSFRLLQEGGKITGVQGILSDISQSKRLERQLQRAHKMEALGFLAGGVAHDLNNILCGIVSYPDLLLRDLPDNSPQRGPLITIKTSGEKASSIVQDLLTLARRGVASTELLNVNHLVEEYLLSAECKTLLALHPEVLISKKLQPVLLNLVGSRTHIAKSLMNLISNAAEAMPSGGTITVTTENRYLDTSLSGFETVREGEYAVLSVEDTGTGIDEEDLARIFEPFYTKKVMGRSGSGLGMTVVWGTVKDHGGHINVHSVPGLGTRFELFFPATRQTLPETVSAIPYEAYQGQGEFVLVVDDVQQQREIAEAMLSRLGYHTEVVDSGEEAIAYLEDNSPTLIVLDMIMDPGIDGFETYKRIVARKPGQKAIIVSGFSESEQVRKTQELGAGQYLKKPYTLETLGMAVRKELERHR